MVEKKTVSRLTKKDQRAVFHIADRAFDLLDTGVKAGMSNPPQGVMAMALAASILHGGAYARPINELPYFLNDPTQSPYYAGDIKAAAETNAAGLFGIISQALFGGSSPANGVEIVREIMYDANVPHVLPKIIDDQAYSIFMLTFAGLTGQDLFKLQSQGLKTLVEGTVGVGGRAIGDVLGGMARGKQAQAALVRADTAAREVGGEG